VRCARVCEWQLSGRASASAPPSLRPPQHSGVNEAARAEGEGGGGGRPSPSPGPSPVGFGFCVEHVWVHEALRLVRRRLGHREREQVVVHEALHSHEVEPAVRSVPR
jgi:hypothetical protein